MSIVIWCSCRYVADESSPAARRESAAGSPPRGAVPAIGWARTTSPDPPDEQLRAGAEEAVHVEQEAAGEGRPQAPQEDGRVEGHVGLDDDLTGQHHLVEGTGVGVAHGLGGPGDQLAPPLGRPHRPHGDLPGQGSGGDHGWRAQGRGVDRRCVAGSDGRHPSRAVVVPTPRHLRDHQLARLVGAERERAERHRSRAGRRRPRHPPRWRPSAASMLGSGTRAATPRPARPTRAALEQQAVGGRRARAGRGPGRPGECGRRARSRVGLPRVAR